MSKTWKLCRFAFVCPQLPAQAHCHAQTYATALLQKHIIDQDTIHHLFPGLLKLLDFQRKFLISMEQIAEHTWKEQTWGKLFTNNVRSPSSYFGVAVLISFAPSSLYSPRKRSLRFTSPTVLTIPTQLSYS
jgi:hypothetical protein